MAEPVKPARESLTPEQLEQEAKLLHEQCVGERDARWDQLPSTTKSVWRGYVLQGQRADLW